VTFQTAGTFPYYCTIHPEMTGTVVVQVAATPAPTRPATSGPTAPPTDRATGGGPAEGSSGAAQALVVIVAAGAAGLGLLRRVRAAGAEPGD
jgi:hypothetical protein